MGDIMSKSVHKEHKNNLQPKAMSTHKSTELKIPQFWRKCNQNGVSWGWGWAELPRRSTDTTHSDCHTFHLFSESKVSVFTQSSCLCLTNSIPDDSPSDERNSGHMTTVSTLELRCRKRGNWRSATVTSQERMPNCLLPVNAHSYAAPRKHLGPT